MRVVKDLFKKGSIHGITVIDLKGEILFTVKFNKKFRENEEGNDYDVIGKNFFDIYENLTPETSSMMRSMELGVPLYVENQQLKSKGRDPIKITSLSIPIKSGNKIVGAVDLSASDTEKKEEYEPVGIMTGQFKKDISTKLSADNSARYHLDDIITEDDYMLSLKEHVKIAAENNLPTLIYGATGTGKELFAHALHNLSARRDKPFVAQNCAAIPENLLESILFGTSRGAFTGAVDNVGLFELVNGGTLFLDELNAMPLHLQSKLLRVLQDGEYRSVGSNMTKKADMRVVAAMNKDPVKAIEDGELRQDIYYRLGVFRINIPPLSERKGDIPLLTNHFIGKYNEEFGKNVRFVSNTVLDKLQEYNWPGNVRELEHIIIYGMSVIDRESDRLQFSHIEEKYNEIIRLDSHAEWGELSLREAISVYERDLIQKALSTAGYNMTQAAKILDIPRQTLHRKAKEHHLI